MTQPANARKLRKKNRFMKILTRTEKPIVPPMKMLATVDGEKVRVLVTHFISERGVYKNRVQTKDGGQHIILNSELDFTSGPQK